ncbi:hypothetical protein [Arthrobacter sp. KNU40]|uniref:hypothetical protein n=1 Tax=Arthrobacter sp. KNU40 TaxID=3447965 RepID=UPI003F6143D8
MTSVNDFKRYRNPSFTSRAEFEAASPFDRATLYLQQFEVCTGLVVATATDRFKAGEKSVSFMSQITLFSNQRLSGFDASYSPTISRLIYGTGHLAFSQSVSPARINPDESTDDLIDHMSLGGAFAVQL